jgi:hypothetical protein
MNREIAMRTREGMTFHDTRKTTSRAHLGCVPRINLGNYSFALNLVADHVKYHATRPDREPSIPCLGAMLSLLKIQVFKYKNTILRSPFEKLLRSAATEILGSMRSLDSQLFEGSNNTPSILSLCLPLSKPSLKSFDCLRSAPILDFPIQAAYKKLISICINRNYCISLIEVDSNRMNALDIIELDRISNVTDESISTILDYNTIDLSSIVKGFSECFRHSVLKMLPAIDCRNAEESVFHEAGISPSISNKKKSKRLMPFEGLIKRMTILPGSDISTSSKSDACTSKLTGYLSLDVAIDSSMRIKSFKRFTKVPGSIRDAIAYLSEAIESLDERFIRLDNYLQGSSSKH